MDIQSASCRCCQQKEVVLQGCVGQMHHLLQCQAVLLPQCNTVDKEDIQGAVVEIHQEV